MSLDVDKIKERLSIVDIVSSYLSLTQIGGNFKAKCPFHNEKTPSFFVSPDRGSYYCFGCGAKGDIFSFVEHFEGTDFRGALKLLADRAGIVLDNNFSNVAKDNKDHLYKIIDEATTFFENIFNSEKAPLDYLKNRGISDDSIKSFRIGYAPVLWQSVSTYLIKKGFKKEDIEKVGLIKIKEDGSYYDRFRSRIIFPISDSSGRVIAFSGRIFSTEDSKVSETEAKYLNSPETILFSKSNTLFGIDKAKISIKKRNYTIIVEGQLDLILSHQAGFSNTVAVSGTALSDRTNKNSSYTEDNTINLNTENIKINNLGLIRRLSSNVIFAFDGDKAGIRAAGRSSLIALSLGMQVKIATMPQGKDPADIISTDINKWKDIIKNSLNIISFYLNIIRQETTDIHTRGKKVQDVIFPFLAVLKSSIERSSYISLIHKEMGINESDIIKDFKSYEQTTKNHKLNIKKENINKIKSRRNRLEERLFGIIFWKIEADKKDDSGIQLVEQIKILIQSFKDKIGEGDFDKMKEKYKERSSVLAFEAEIWYGNKINKVIDDMNEIVLNLEEETLNDKLFYLQTEIYQKETNGNKEEVSLLLKDYQKIVERIEEIKSFRTK